MGENPYPTVKQSAVNRWTGSSNLPLGAIMKKYIYLNTALFRNGAIQLYRVYDTEIGDIYYMAVSEGKGRTGFKQTFIGTRKEVNRWRQFLGSN